MRIIQIVPSLYYGDAVGNDILALDKIIREKKIETRIYAADIGKKIDLNRVSLVSTLSLHDDDIVILHVAGANDLNNWIKDQPGKKIMVYHNITPPNYFAPYDEIAMENCSNGLSQVFSMSNVFDMILAVSSYNASDLRRMGYKTEMKVLPILIPFSDYDQTPNAATIEKYSNDGYTNILFVGRIAPNKCHQDVIATFDAYQKNYNPKSRLFIVGNPSPQLYLDKLKLYVKKMGTKNVIFPGHTKFDEILAYYRLSDLFLCQSEHEGFCVPLVEAMYFHKPIVAYDSSAIGETLGGGGFLMKEKNPVETAAVMNRILTDNKLRDTIIQNQNERLQDFKFEKIRDLFWECIGDFLN